MDLSKLRRVSGEQRAGSNEPAEDRPPADNPRPTPAPVDYGPPRELGTGPEVWLSLVVGIILMVMGWQFAQWAITTLTGGTYDTEVVWRTPDKNGQMVPYWQLIGHQALSESAIFLFGLAMVMEAAAMTVGLLVPRFWRPAIFGSMLMSILMTVYNALAVVVLLKDKQTPLVSLLAIGFGGYMAMAQWRALRNAAG